MGRRGTRQKVGNGNEWDWLYRFWAGVKPRRGEHVYCYTQNPGVGTEAKRALARRRRRASRAEARAELEDQR